MVTIELAQELMWHKFLDTVGVGGVHVEAYTYKLATKTNHTEQDFITIETSNHLQQYRHYMWCMWRMFGSIRT